MKFFMSCEAQTPASDYIFSMMRTISPILKEKFSKKDYGKDVEFFAIISACVSKDFIEDSGWKERNRYSKKDKSTDVRLFIDWEKFTTVPEKERKKMYIEHIYQSIIQFHEKHKKLDFDGASMLNDAKEVLSRLKF